MGGHGLTERLCLRNGIKYVGKSIGKTLITGGLIFQKTENFTIMVEKEYTFPRRMNTITIQPQNNLQMLNHSEFLNPSNDFD